MDQDFHLRLAFPTVFQAQAQRENNNGGSPSRNYTSFDSIKEYIRCFRQQKSILSESAKDVQNLRKRLQQRSEGHGRLKIHQFQSNGSALVFEKEQQQSFTKIYFLYDQHWQTDCLYNEETNGGVFYQIGAGKYQVLYIGQITNTIGLSNVFNQFMKCYRDFDEKLKNIQNKNYVGLSQKAIYICKKTIEHLINKNFFYKNEIQQKFVKVEKMYRDNFYDLQKVESFYCLKPETEMALNWAIIYFYSRNDDLINALKADYKLLILSRCIDNYQNSNSNLAYEKSRIVQFLQCVKDLRSDFQSLNGNNNYYYNNKKSTQALVSLVKLIHSFDKPSKQQEFSLSQLGRHHKLQEFKVNVHYMAPSIENLTAQKPENMNNLTYTMKISGQKSFQSLIQKFHDCDGMLWLLIAEDTIFTLVFNELHFSDPFKTLNLNLIKIKQNYSENENQLIRFYNLYTRRASANGKLCGMTLDCQIYSHMSLMKIIICVIGFEVFKNNNLNTIYNVSQFRLPIRFDEFYKSFNSVSYKARRAVDMLYKYFDKQKDMHPFFDQKIGYQSYKAYAEQVSGKSQEIKKQLKKKVDFLKQQKKQLKQRITQFHDQYNEIVQKHERAKMEKKSHCQCYEKKTTAKQYDSVKGKNVQVVISTQVIQCKPCIKERKLRMKISDLEEKKFDYIQTTLPEQEEIVHEFFYHIDPDLEGLINLALICQHSTSAEQKSFNTNSQVFFIKGFLKIFKSLSKCQRQFFINVKQEDIDRLVTYSSPKVQISWQNKNNPSIQYKLNSAQISIFNTQLNKIFNEFFKNPTSPPINNQQHKIYANLNTKPSSMRLEQYISIGSCRVGEFTQIPMILESLLNRSILANTLQKDYQSKLYIIYRCLSSLQATKPQQFSFETNQNIWNGSKYFFTYFMDNYYKDWTSQDFGCLPVIGPILSLMSRTVTDLRTTIKQLDFIFTDDQIKSKGITSKKVIKRIMKKIKIEYERIDHDIKNSAEKQAKFINNNLQNQYFICFGGICCFTEMLLNSQQDLVVQFTKLIVIMKFKEVYLSTDSAYAKVVQKYEHFKIRAIESNIQTALKYFQNHPNKLTQVVRIVDQDIEEKTKWRKDIGGMFLFKGEDKWGNTYKIDIKCGKVIKNDKSISRVPDQFKNMVEYTKIFQKRDFQVFPSPKKQSLITKRNFSDLFVGNISSQDSALFEFSYTSTHPVISLLIRYKKAEYQESWRLIPKKDIKQFLPIPLIYEENYLAWYSQRRSCIIFRQPSFSKIGEVGLVIFLQKNNKPEKKATHLHIISRQHLRSTLDLICNPGNEIFDKLILRKKKDGLAFDVLSKIERREYILQLETYENKQRKFWLHRFDSMFIQDQMNGILPESFKNYRLSSTPYNHSYIPWGEKDKISCLVLQKFITNEISQQFHQTKILIPQWLVDHNGKIQIPEARDVNQSCTFYVYDIHDHFMDIRGGDRLSQLHLASILAGVNKGIKNPHIKITPIEYALKILNSCFNNCPLNEAEKAEIKNIIAIGTYQKSQSLIITCYALVKCTMQIESLKKEPHNFEVTIFKKQQMFRNSISQAINKYEMKLRNNRVTVRMKLSDVAANIIGINEQTDKFSKGKKRAWRKQNKLIYSLPKLPLNEMITRFKEMLSAYDTLNKSITKDSSLKQSKQKQFPLSIENPEQNTLLQQVKQELKNSYRIYNITKQELKYINIDKNKVLSQFQQFKKKLYETKQEISRLFNGLILQNYSHVDVATNFNPLLSTFDYVPLLIEANGEVGKIVFERFFPDFNNEEDKIHFKLDILNLIRYWIISCVKLDSCQRVINIIQHQIQSKIDQTDLETDKIALLRQFQSPREQIENRIHWVCFEAQMKIQIWKSQYQTFKSLFLKNKSGSISQLNMGQGKTQVIIPMIALQLFYGKDEDTSQFFGNKSDKSKQKSSKKIPRVNFMQSLINQSKLNYFRFLSCSAFNIPIAIMPFDRQVNFRNSEQNFHSLIRSLGYFNKKVLVLIDQSSTHSLILKLRQQTLNKKTQIFNKEENVFKDMDVFDIFDEVDAQLSPKKSFIYSIGGGSDLDEEEYRISIAASLLETLSEISLKLFNQKYITFQQTFQDTKWSLQRGQFPRGFRLLQKQNNEETKMAFRKIVLEKFFQSRYDETKFLELLNQQELMNVVTYLIEETQNDSRLSNKITAAAKKILYILRGFLAYGVLQHCLSLRCKVNYGVPDQKRKEDTKKRLAVPYEAADIPSKKNDYAHPDVAILLSYLSYYNYGLNQQEVVQCIQKLQKLNAENDEARNKIFKQWFQSLSGDQQEQLKIKNTLEIQLHSITQKQRLVKAFRMNRKFIAYWLKYCVFLKDMRQYLSSITSSSWDQVDVKSCIGFSGTKDNCRLLPTYVQLIQSDNKQIAGTDGKMLDMLLQNVLQVRDMQKSNDPLWVRFLNTVFNIPVDLNVSSIIDAGAILGSKSLKNDIVPWIFGCKKFNTKNKLKGISFCLDNNWKIFKLSNLQYIDRGTSVPDNETFVIFDEYRTRGADIKMDANACAVLTLNSSLTKDNLMQAVGRLRKIGRNQKVIIVMTDEVKMRIKKEQNYNDKMNVKQKVKAILGWSCINSVRQNQKYLLANTKLANIHIKNKRNPAEPYVDKSDTSVEFMYSSPIKYRSILDLCETEMTEVSETQIKELFIVKKLKITYSKYGRKRKMKSQNFDEVCERQTELVTQFIMQRTQEKYSLSAKHEKDDIIEKRLEEYHKFKFSNKLRASVNFMEVTQTLYPFSGAVNRNQLMYCYFILMDTEHICLVTQREVYQLLSQQKLPFFMTDFEQNKKRYIARLSDLNASNQFIKKYGLQQALVQSKFFNGSIKYEQEGEKYIIKNLLREDRQKQKKIKYFLRARNQHFKFSNSDLEKILKELELMPEYFDQIASHSNNALQNFSFAPKQEAQNQQADEQQEQEEDEQDEDQEDDEDDEDEDQDQDDDEEDQEGQQDQQQDDQNQQQEVQNKKGNNQANDRKKYDVN